MTWLHPWALLALVSVPVLIALSLWRWRRREVAVSSLLLWRDVAAQWHQAPQARRRRRVDPLVALRLAVALALTAAACGLVAVRPLAGGRAVVIVVDRSASMAMRRPDGRTRWDVCRAELAEALGRLGPADRVEVIAVPDTGGAPAEGLTRDDAAAALRRIAPSDQAVEPRQLVAEATAAARRAQDAAVVVATDEQLPGLPAGVAVLAVGGGAPNLGIVAFAAERSPAGQDQVLVAVANGGAEAATASVSILADGREVGSRELNVPARGRAHAVLDGDFGSAAALEARLAGRDALDADNRAWLARRAGGVRVALVGEGGYYLRRALAVQPGLEVVGFLDRPEECVPRGFDLAVYYRVVPRKLGSGTAVIVAPREALGALRPGELVSVAGEAVVQRRDPLLDAVDLAGVKLGRVPRIAEPPGFETLASAGGAPLVGRWREDGATVVYVGIDPSEGDWPTSVSFPVFWQNVVGTAAGRGGPGGFASTRPGEILRVAPEGEAAAVVAPDGSRREVPGGVFRPEQVGLYRTTRGEREEISAVSLLSEAETMSAGADVPLPPSWPGRMEGEGAGTVAWRLTGWLAGLGLALVVAHGWLTARARAK